MTDTHLHLVRVTIEALSPLSLGNGDAVAKDRVDRDDPTKTETIHATALLRDANDLPTVPGASVQGVLSHLYRRVFDDKADTNMFGYAQGDLGEMGRLSVGFGCVHDQHDVAVTGLMLGETNDPILTLLQGPKQLWRDHVALGARHVVAGRQKFARTAVPVGTRFSFELSLRGQKEDSPLLDVLRLFNHPDFRLGGASARGYGRVRVLRLTRQVCDLTDPHVIRDLRKQPPSTPLAEVLHDALGQPPAKLAPPASDTVTACVVLTPQNPWRIGGESPQMTIDTRGMRRANGEEEDLNGVLAQMEQRTARDERGNERQNTLTIAREPRLMWGGTVATIEEVRTESRFDANHPGAFALPGSALRGPLAHRALFHFNRHKPGGAGMIDVDEWLQLSKDEREKKLAELAERPAVFHPLFGAAKGKKTVGAAARLRVNDGKIEDVTHVMAIDHNKIDRFTGGVINGALYAEEVLVGGKIEFEIQIMPPLSTDRTTRPADPTAIGGWPKDVAEAFLRALADLRDGRLAIGAKSLGFCKGSVEWQGDAPQTKAWRDAWAPFEPGSGTP